MDMLTFHRSLIFDEVGQEAFRQAIFAAVKGGETVVDIGTGTGIHAMFACQAGASKIYAIEQDPIIQLARENCNRNGFSDRIEFIQGRAEAVTLPERGNLLTIHMGILDTIYLVSHVRDKFLVAGGTVIPAALELFCAPISSKAIYEVIYTWDSMRWGLDFTAARNLARISTHAFRIESHELLSRGQSIAPIDLQTITTPLVDRCVEIEIQSDGVLHGFGLWFVEQLYGDITISTAPPCKLPLALWPNRFFPAIEPITVKAGDMALFHLTIFGSDSTRLWDWSISVLNKHGTPKCQSV